MLVEVDAVEKNKRIVLSWYTDPNVEPGYKSSIEMNFEPLDECGTFGIIAEIGCRDDEAGCKASYKKCEDWSQILSCMKAYVECGIKLRESF